MTFGLLGLVVSLKPVPPPDAPPEEIPRLSLLKSKVIYYPFIK